MESRQPQCDTAGDGAVAEAPNRPPERKLHTAGSTDFEYGRIRELKSERLRIQQKTFTKWINSFLLKSAIQVIRIMNIIIPCSTADVELVKMPFSYGRADNA